MSYFSSFSPFAKHTFLKPACLCHLHKILTPPLAVLHAVASYLFSDTTVMWSARRAEGSAIASRDIASIDSDLNDLILWRYCYLLVSLSNVHPWIQSV